MVRSSYIIIVSGMGDDVPILGAVVTLLKADGLLLFLMMLLYISMVRSSCISILSGMGDDPLGPPFSFYECTDSLDPHVRQKLKERNEIVRKFWNKYMEQYIPALQKSHKWKQPEPDIQINDIVMVRPDTANLTLKRPYWRKGRVVDVRMGRDNKIRNLKVFLPIRYNQKQ